MVALLDLLVGLIELALLDLKEMKPIGRVVAVVSYFVLGAILLAFGLALLLVNGVDTWAKLGGAFVVVLGLVVFVRIVFALASLRRGAA